MKKIALFLCLFLNFTVHAQKMEPGCKTLLLTGASFATSANGWFEIGCELLGYKGINRAVGALAIADAANQMAEGKLYSFQELDSIDALVIMHVHEQDVFVETNLKKDYTEYTVPFDRKDYAGAYDYVIKRYITECYLLKDNPESRYYGSKIGKPPVILLCTHWHNARTLFNSSVRKLAEKWGLPLVEFDRHIGFNAQMKHPVTGKSFSFLFAQDSQEINGVAYGWHPTREEGSYIQKKMGGIFAEKIKSVFNGLQ